MLWLGWFWRTGACLVEIKNEKLGIKEMTTEKPEWA
jgi:hypothetical protein